jgi:hypothetical protein
MLLIVQALARAGRIVRRLPQRSAVALLLTLALTRTSRGVIPIQDTTVTGTLTIPSGETGDLGGTVTLDNGLLSFEHLASSVVWSGWGATGYASVPSARGLLVVVSIFSTHERTASCCCP